MKSVALALLLLVPSVRADEPPAFNPLATFEHVVSSGRSRDAGRVTFQLGSAKYSFASGVLLELVGKDGVFAGWYFAGSGSVTFPAENAGTSKVFGDNARRLGGFDVADDGALRASFSNASFWLSEAARPPLDGFAAEASPVLAASFEAHRKRFVKDRFAEPEPALAAALLAKRPYAQVLIEGGRGLRHEVDDLFSGTERVAVEATMEAAPAGYLDWRFSRDVLSRPLGRARHTAPRVEYRLTELDVDVRERTEQGWGDLVVKETLVPERPLRALGFVLRSDSIAGIGLGSASVRMNSVIGEDGKSLPFSFAKDRLIVYLPAEVPAKRPVRLTFDYMAGYFGRPGGDNYWELALGEDWYPAASDWRTSSLFTYHAVIRARKPFTPFTSGDTVRRGEDGDFNLVETRLDRPTSMVGVLAGKYTIQEETKDGITCRVASYAVSKEKSGAKLIALFHTFRKFYEPYFGPFPWKEFTIVEINGFGYGQAPAGMMRITHEAFQMNIFGDPRAELFSQGINERIAHEVAHAWWGHVVWGAADEDQWIEEAFAEMAAGYAIESLKSKSEFSMLTNVWKTRGKESRGKSPIWLVNSMEDKASLQPNHDSTEDRYFILYFKGATLLQGIRTDVGEDAFFTSLKSFLRSFEKKPAVTTEQFVGLLSFITKKDWKPWFEKYYYGLEMP
jgi:hypothetical protein